MNKVKKETEICFLSFLKLFLAMATGPLRSGLALHLFDSKY